MTLENNKINNFYLSPLRKDYMKLTRVIPMHTRFFIVGISILMLPACGKPPEPQIEVSRPVKMMTVGSAGASAKLEYPGVVDSIQQVDLGFEVAGQIIELPITSGQNVMKGDLLARLEPRDYKAARDSAASHLHAMRAANSRAKRIFDQNAGSQAEVDDALRNFRVAEQVVYSAGYRSHHPEGVHPGGASPQDVCRARRAAGVARGDGLSVGGELHQVRHPGLARNRRRYPSGFSDISCIQIDRPVFYRRHLYEKTSAVWVLIGYVIYICGR